MGRTPLGDKGLGRLGVQRLGEHLDIFTKCESEPAYHVAFSWGDFRDKGNKKVESIADVSIDFENTSHWKKQGTRIVISNLYEPEMWGGEGAAENIQKELMTLISPYEESRDFTLKVVLNDKDLDIPTILEKHRNLADVRFILQFDRDILSVQCRIGYGYFDTKGKEDNQKNYAELKKDRGKSFFQFLTAQKIAPQYSLEYNSSGYFLESSIQIYYEDIVKPPVYPDSSPANPGAFHGQIDFFNIEKTKQQLGDNFAQKLFETLGGVRIYRNGFLIRMDDDWMKLGKLWTTGRSYYGLKPNNTFGYIMLSTDENEKLEETTDREGFTKTPYSDAFHKIIEAFVRHSATLQNFVRRAWNDFCRTKVSQDFQDSPTKIVRHIKEKLATAQKQQERLIQSKETVEKVESAVKDIQKNGLFIDQVIDELLPLKEQISAATQTIREVGSYLQTIGDLEKYGEVLEDQFQEIQDRLSEVYNAISLGLVAESLCHEIEHIADELITRAKLIEKKLSKAKIPPETSIFIEVVYSAASALRKQVAFLAPGLRYVRETKKVIQLSQFFDEFASFHSETLSRENIAVKISIAKNTTPFAVRMNEGKLRQIFNNFILNSEYWLRERIKNKKQASGTIYIEQHYPFVYIWDDGLGVAPSIEYTLFEAFATMKEKGRGLGLFIVNQLLGEEKCSAELLQDRNNHKRLYKFQIDLQGVLHEQK